MQSRPEEKLQNTASEEDNKLSSSGGRWLRFGNLCCLELPDGTVYEFDFSCG